MTHGAVPSEHRVPGSHWHTDLDEGIDRHDGHVGLGFGVIHQVEVDEFLQLRVARLHTVNDVREEGAANNKREKARCSPSRISINKTNTGMLFLYGLFCVLDTLRSDSLSNVQFVAPLTASFFQNVDTDKMPVLCRFLKFRVCWCLLEMPYLKFRIYYRSPRSWESEMKE